MPAGKGIGSALLKQIFAELAENGIGYFWCDVRESAMGFYARFGMKPEGSRFYKGEVPYYKVGINLNQVRHG